MHNAVTAAGAIMCYLEITQHTRTGHITTIRRVEADSYVRLDRFTVRNLELIAPMNDDGTSLLQVLDHTCTPMGARMLRRWVLFPLQQPEAIRRRQDGVEHFFRDTAFRDLIAEEMAKVVPMSAWFADDCPLHAVPDPYYGGQEGFDQVVQLLTTATRQMASDIARAES